MIENSLREKVTAEDRGFGTPCLIWSGATDSGGYGKTGGRPAHRVFYEREVGPIPEGHELDHLCRVRLCVNPDHLEPVTRRENLMRGDTLAAENANKTECKNGHPFDAANTLIRSDGSRACRTCLNSRKREQRASSSTDATLPARRSGKLSASDIARIKRAPKSVTNRDLAAELGCSTHTIHRHRGSSRPGKYSEQDKDKAVTAYLLNGANAAAAARELHESAVLNNISPATINAWVKHDPMRVQRIRALLQPQLDQELTDAQEDNARLLTELERQAAIRTGEVLDELRPGEVAGALRNISQAKSATLEKAALRRGQPTQIQETRNVGEIVSALRRLGLDIRLPGAEPGADSIDADATDARQLGPGDSGLADAEDGDAATITP